MQRNINILRNKTPLRSGMAMILAIAFLVVIAGIMATMLNLSSLGNKRSEHLYFKEQAQLLAKSATEYALLAISAHDRTGGSCITTINSQFPASNPYYNITTNIRYIGLEDLGGTCQSSSPINPTSLVSTISTPESIGTVLIDVQVSNINTGLTENVVFHRRTLQKP
ncbi:MAG TPA: type II secretion system protein [Sulfurimonas sp.]|nr:type II secretion system protein [Sulfurimonas sp.]